jgi:hypothetical protein
MVSHIEKTVKRGPLKKLWALFMVSLYLISAAPAQESPIDLILILDTSSSMAGSYQGVVSYITGPFLREFLRTGDTFHLISFSDSPRTEISRRIEETGDVETIIGRMLLMYPLDIYSDIPGALEYGEQYVRSLPPGRNKKVVLISDGEHSPRAGSSRAGLDAAAVQGFIGETEARLKQRGIDFYFVKIPLVGNGPASGRAGRGTQSASPVQPARPARVQQGQGQSQPSPGTGQAGQVPQGGITTPAGPISQAGSTATVQSGSTTAPAGPISQAGSTATAQSGSTTAPAGPISQSGSTATAQSGSSGAAGGFPAEESAVNPPEEAAQGFSPGEPAGSSGAGGGSPAEGSSALGGNGAPNTAFGLPLILALIIGVALIIGLIIFFAARRLRESPSRTIVSAASEPKISPRIIPQDGEEKRKDETVNRDAELLASFAANQRRSTLTAASRRPAVPDHVNESMSMNGSPMLSLFVEGQNTSIGRRNIHTVKPGYTLSVGGGKSDFLIFMVPMPPHIADVHFDGNQCTFIPRKPQFFPDIGSQQVSNCIGRTIRVLSEKKYEFFIRIDRFQDPLVALNRLLYSIRTPEK